MKQALQYLWLLPNDRQKAQEHNKMIYPKLNCFFFQVVTELSAVVYIAPVRKAANTAQNIAAEHSARENPAGRECTTIGTSPLREFAASQGPRGIYTAIS